MNPVYLYIIVSRPDADILSGNNLRKTNSLKVTLHILASFLFSINPLSEVLLYPICVCGLDVNKSINKHHNSPALCVKLS